MNFRIRIFSRILFLIVWFGFGYFVYNDIAVGLFSALCAFILIEIFYYLDRKTSDAEDISLYNMSIDRIQSVKTLIIRDLNNLHNNIHSTSNYSKGKQQGLEDAMTVVAKQLTGLIEDLEEEKSQI